MVVWGRAFDHVANDLACNCKVSEWMLINGFSSLVIEKLTVRNSVGLLGSYRFVYGSRLCNHGQKLRHYFSSVDSEI